MSGAAGMPSNSEPAPRATAIVIPPASGLRRVQELWYFTQEALGMLILTRNAPGRLTRRLMRLPTWLFRARLGFLLNNQVLLLTTTGRKTGRPRTTPVGYLHDPTRNVYYITAGWGGRTQWLANIRANSSVTIQTHGRPRPAHAHLAPRQEALAVLQAYTARNPYARRIWTRWTGTPFDGTTAALERVHQTFPTVAITPK